MQLRRSVAVHTASSQCSPRPDLNSSTRRFRLSAPGRLPERVSERHTAERTSSETETAKTLRVVDSALRAVQGALDATQGPCTGRRSLARRSFGGFAGGPGRLAEARRSQKERVRAEQRSLEFNTCLQEKLEGLADLAVSCSTSCGSSTPDLSPV
eukprot:TRINITY_DN33238_c0_g2_i1.p1 TRINITY_DN33238_c0_g2~~TRINITY_DN33238_c0_g2_i1.p1  ORF type:complete len:175 (-),score=38.32 TRINITY_DN33238_c0_g2_i1:85-549(-)